MDKKLLSLLSIFFLTFLFFISVIVFQKPLSNITRAEKDSQPSSTTSLLFAWPLTTRADGQTEVKIDVFVRSETNKPIENRKVTLSTSLGKISILSDQSDKGGKTTFQLTSDTEGEAEVSATIDNSIPISQKLNIKFE